MTGEVYSRPEQASIDAWGDMFRGDTNAWSWSNLFPFYRSSEGLAPLTTRQAEAGNLIDPDYHGFDGPVSVSYPADPAPEGFFHAFEETAAHFGIMRLPDLNGGSTHGISTYPLTIRVIDGEENRESSREAYYLPVATRTNLELLADTTCLRLDWEERGNVSSPLTARGVQITNSSATDSSDIRIVLATSEVVLSAGTYRSSTILEFSGIGNTDILNQLNITTLINLPGVGENLQDQTQGSTSFRMSNDTRVLLDHYHPTSPPTRLRTNYIIYATFRDILGEDADQMQNRVRTLLPYYAQNISARINNALSPSMILQSLQVQYDLIFIQELPVVELFATISNTTGQLGMQHWNLMPLSRGNVHISGPDPIRDGSNPVIDNNFFFIDYDWEMFLSSSRFLRTFFNTTPLSTFVEEEVRPGLQNVPLNATDEEWRDYWIPRFTNEWHPIGSCAMLPRSWGGVVDDELRVYGTQNVRVVDASVMPFGMGGHPTSTLYAMAERLGVKMRTTRGEGGEG